MTTPQDWDKLGKENVAASIAVAQRLSAWIDGLRDWLLDRVLVFARILDRITDALVALLSDLPQRIGAAWVVLSGGPVAAADAPPKPTAKFLEHVFRANIHSVNRLFELEKKWPLLSDDEWLEYSIQGRDLAKLGVDVAHIRREAGGERVIGWDANGPLMATASAPAFETASVGPMPMGLVGGSLVAPVAAAGTGLAIKLGVVAAVVAGGWFLWNRGERLEAERDAAFAQRDAAIERINDANRAAQGWRENADQQASALAAERAALAETKARYEAALIAQDRLQRQIRARREETRREAALPPAADPLEWMRRVTAPVREPAPSSAGAGVPPVPAAPAGAGAAPELPAGD